MNKNIVIGILGAALVALLTVILWPKPGSIVDPSPVGPIGSTNIVNGVTNVVIETKTMVDGEEKKEIVEEPIIRSVERRPLEPEATKRLHDGPVVVTSLFEASGKAEHASYGKAIRGSYLYTTTVKARSEIVSKEENETTGSVRVVEKRTFLQSRDHLALSDLDFVVALDTLPVAQVKRWVDGAVNVVGGVVSCIIPAAAPVVATVKADVWTAFKALEQIDGAAARGMLGLFGVKIPVNLEGFVNDRISKYASKQLQDVHVALQSIEGKSYIITYTQEKDGRTEKHLRVDFTHENGEPISEAEWEILRQANVFLDSNMVPDTRCKVGDHWNVWADEVQDLFGAVGEGRAEGKICVTRTEDTPDGDWTLRLDRTEVTFRNDSGTTSGKMEIKDGNGLVDAANKSVESLQTTATGNLRSMNKKRHALFFDFVKRVQGDSNLRFTLTSKPAAKGPND